jgi:subtilisin family serine protease
MGAERESYEGAYDVLPWGATSSAAPQVASLAALVRSLRPDLSSAAVIHLIEQGADPIGAPGFHEETGYGRINFRKTLELAQKQLNATQQPKAE